MLSSPEGREFALKKIRVSQVFYALNLISRLKDYEIIFQNKLMEINTALQNLKVFIFDVFLDPSLFPLWSIDCIP
jgi:hypothetical protein